MFRLMFWKTKRFVGRAHNHVPLLSISLLVMLPIVSIALFALASSVDALPEYAARTGEACGTCHVSPGGAGPLTLRGLLWVSEDRPDQVPVFENVLLAPSVNDAAALYEIACAPCHGLEGEGLSASALAGYGFSKSLVRRAIVKGLPYYNMPAFEGQFTDAQLAALAAYVSDFTAGRVEPLESYPVEAGEFGCDDEQARCGEN